MTCARFDVIGLVLGVSRAAGVAGGRRAGVLLILTLCCHATSRIPIFSLRNPLNVTLAPLLL